MMIISGKDCEGCPYATFDESNKAKIMIYCADKNRALIYGTFVQCDKSKKKNKNE